MEEVFFNKQPPDSTAGGTFGRAFKKTMKRSKEPPNLNDQVVDNKGRSVPSGENHVASWKDMLLGTAGNIRTS